MFIMLSWQVAKISLGEIEVFFSVLEKERMGLLAYFEPCNFDGKLLLPFSM